MTRNDDQADANATCRAIMSGFVRAPRETEVLVQFKWTKVPLRDAPSEGSDSWVTLF